MRVLPDVFLNALVFLVDMVWTKLDDCLRALFWSRQKRKSEPTALVLSNYSSAAEGWSE